jgi:hypothetical protein
VRGKEEVEVGLDGVLGFAVSKPMWQMGFRGASHECLRDYPAKFDMEFHHLPHWSKPYRRGDFVGGWHFGGVRMTPVFGNHGEEELKRYESS